MNSQNELLEGIKKLVFYPKTIVSCPEVPFKIDGITPADAFDAGDAMGTISEIAVPKSGILVSATFFDLDDEGSQVDLMIFKASFSQNASDSAWAPGDTDILQFITELSFVGFDDHGGNRTSEINGIDKAYNAPLGKFYIQAVTRGTPTIAAGSEPRFQLQIMSFDPDFEG